MGVESQREQLRRIYSPDLYEKNAALITVRLTEHLRGVSDQKTVNWVRPSDPFGQALAFLAEEKRPELAEIVNWYLEGVNRLHSPRCIGHQVAPPVPLAAIFDGMAALTNQGSALFEVGPTSGSAERAVVTKLGERIGWKDGFDGFGTHGGTLANLTALLAARNVHFPEAWEKGIANFRPVILAGADSHYSISRAAGIMGLGSDAVEKLPLDEKRRVDVAKVRPTLERVIQGGKIPFCLVGTAGTTPVGAFDPLAEMGEIARELGIWFHVDGAHGASALFSRAHRAKCAGIELADSVTWDAHKMLYTPGLSTFLLFREKEKSYRTVAQDAPYLFDEHAVVPSAFDPGLRTIECTRRALALSLLGIWSVYGPKLFEDLIDVTFETTREFYETLRASADFQPLHEPESNILCFRYLPATSQTAIRTKLLEQGDFYITRTKLDGESVLRVTVMNPLTTPVHLEALLAAIRAAH